MFFHWLSGFGRKDVVEHLLQTGANVHARDDGGLIPLHNACSFGHAEVVSLLLCHGADPNARDNWNYTPLHEAAIKGKIDVCIGKDTNQKSDSFSNTEFCFCKRHKLHCRLLCVTIVTQLFLKMIFVVCGSGKKTSSSFLSQCYSNTELIQTSEILMENLLWISPTLLPRLFSLVSDSANCNFYTRL